jgi:transposase InsO family protein
MAGLSVHSGRILSRSCKGQPVPVDRGASGVAHQRGRRHAYLPEENGKIRWDNFSRECLAIEAGQSITGADVAAVVDRLVKKRGVPDRIQCDNGSEFISRVLDKRAYENGIAMDFSRPGKPMDNAMIESFNGTFRDECLNVNWFISMEDEREKIEKWRTD